MCGNKDSFSKVSFYSPHQSDLSRFHLNLTFWQCSSGKNSEGWILSEFDLKGFSKSCFIFPSGKKKKKKVYMWESHEAENPVLILHFLFVTQGTRVF